MARSTLIWVAKLHVLSVLLHCAHCSEASCSEAFLVCCHWLVSITTIRGIRTALAKLIVTAIEHGDSMLG